MLEMNARPWTILQKDRVIARLKSPASRDIAVLPLINTDNTDRTERKLDLERFL
jgi:hypothetical protein